METHGQQIIEIKLFAGVLVMINTKEVNKLKKKTDRTSSNWLHKVTAQSDCTKWLHKVTAQSDCTKRLHKATAQSDCTKRLHKVTAQSEACRFYKHFVNWLLQVYAEAASIYVGQAADIPGAEWEYGRVWRPCWNYVECPLKQPFSKSCSWGKP